MKIRSVLVRVGQKVSQGSPLLSVEAMKMAAAITAERDATVVRFHVVPGNPVDPRDLLLELA